MLLAPSSLPDPSVVEGGKSNTEGGGAMGGGAMGGGAMGGGAMGGGAGRLEKRRGLRPGAEHLHRAGDRRPLLLAPRLPLLDGFPLVRNGHRVE